MMLSCPFFSIFVGVISGASTLAETELTHLSQYCSRKYSIIFTQEKKGVHNIWFDVKRVESLCELSSMIDFYNAFFVSLPQTL
jgi:hypothetical protein